VATAEVAADLPALTDFFGADFLALDLTAMMSWI
jgi:hypothetical protein